MKLVSHNYSASGQKLRVIHSTAKPHVVTRTVGEKGYAESFAMDGRQIVKIGVNFRKDTRGIEEWKIG